MIQMKYNFILLSLDSLDRGSLNYSPWVKSGLTSIFIKKLLLEHSHTHLLTYCLLLLSPYKDELSSCNRLTGLQSLKYLLPGPSQKKFDDSWSCLDVGRHVAQWSVSGCKSKASNFLFKRCHLDILLTASAPISLARPYHMVTLSWKRGGEV